MNEFERFIKLIGIEKFNTLQNKKVLIIGIGGVGGYALEAIVRSGINNVVIVDYDNIDITNLNRQIISLNNNINEKKVDIAKKRALAINPNINITTYDTFLDKNNIDTIIQSDIDYVIDSCDSTTTKEEIILKCLKENIKFISCMGTANKFDPTLLTITDIRKTNYDKLAKKIRKWVNDNKIKDKIPVVSSKEECKKISCLGSTSFVPGTAGLLCASYVINNIIKEE